MNEPSATVEQLFTQAVQAYQTGQRQDAVTLARQVLARQSNHAGALYLIGGTALDDKHAEIALPYLEAAARIDSRHPDIQRALGMAHLHLKHWDSAVESLQRALVTYSDDAGLLNNLGIAHKERGDIDAAIRCYRQALEFNKNDAHIYNNLGIALDRLHTYADAIDAYRHSIDLDSKNPAVWSNLSVLLEQANRIEETQTAVTRGLTLDPHHTSLNITAAKCMRRQGDPEGAICRLKPLLTRSDTGIDARRAIESELGRNHDILGDTESAFLHFGAANRLALEVWPEVTEAARAYDYELDLLLEQFTSTWIKSWLSQSRPRQPSTPQSLAFLVGFLRSGTTLMDTLIGAHTDIAVFEEEPYLENTLNRLRVAAPCYPQALAGLAPDEWDALRADYWQAVAHHRPVSASPSLVLDKNPLMSAHAGYIHTLFPRARFLFALRHPCDVILSCYMQTFGGSSVLGNFLDLESSARTYARVMKLWVRYQEIFRLEVHELRYEALATGPQPVLRAALDFLGVTGQVQPDNHLAHARRRGRIYTPSYYQVIEPVNMRAIDRWQRYAAHFGAALEILQPWVQKFGYKL